MEPCRLGIGEEVDDIVEAKVRTLDVEGYFVRLDEVVVMMMMMLLLATTLSMLLLLRIDRIAVATLLCSPRCFGDLYFGVHCH